MECRFCDIIQRKIEDYILWENNNFIVLLNTKPTIPGTCMVIPKKHIDYLFDLPEDLYSEIFIVARDISKALKSAMNAKRIGMFLSGFEIPHAHLFLIPMQGPYDFVDSSKRSEIEHEELLKFQNTIKKHLPSPAN